MEELLAGPPERPARRRLAGLVTAVVLVVAAAVVVDEQVRAREVGRLLEQVEEGEGAVVYAERRVAAMVTYASPLLWSSDTPPRLRRDLERLAQEAAGAGADRVRQVGEGVSATSVLPWHAEVDAARDAYAAHLHDRADYLDRVADDFVVLFEGDVDVGPSRARVVEAFASVGSEGRQQARTLLPAR